MKKTGKIITMAAACALMLSGVTPVEASVASTETVTEETYGGVGSYDYSVEITKASSFSVKIPKKIIMGGQVGDNESEYVVEVAGDIPGYATITVTPEAEFKFNQSGKNEVKANVTQEKKSFGVADMATGSAVANGTVSVSGLTAGKWNGAFRFQIGYTEAGQ